MRRHLFTAALAVFLFCLAPSAVFAAQEKETSPKHEAQPDPGKNLYTVETDNESASESLDRISGHFETGYSSSEDSFKSKDHHPNGPWGLEKAETGQS